MWSDGPGAGGIRGIGKLPPPSLRIDERTKNPSKRKHRGEHPDGGTPPEPPPRKGKVDINA
ncbi:MAG: hypothetical protein OHK0028_08970 [Deltaproteobacteria bacterium]